MVEIGKADTEKAMELEKKAAIHEAGEELFTEDLICELIGKVAGHPVTDMFEAGDVLMDEIFFEGYEKREELFKTFLDVTTDVSWDWFRFAFQKAMADRTKLKQDFSPSGISGLVSTLVEPDDRDKMGATNLDVGAGTGSLTIARWQSQRKRFSPFEYKPSMFMYQCEEFKEQGKKSRALPWLLFNMLLRGVNAIVISGDSLTRSVSQIYWITNTFDDHLKFSDLNVMPRNKETESEFNVRRWIDDPVNYYESKMMWSVDDDGSQSLLTYNDQTVKEYEQKRQNAIDEQNTAERMLNVVKNMNANNPNAKKIKDLPKDDRDNLGDQLDGILKIFGVEPDPQIRKQYFG